MKQWQHNKIWETTLFKHPTKLKVLAVCITVKVCSDIGYQTLS